MPLFRNLYLVLHKELQIIKKYLDQQITLGRIRFLSLSIALSIVLARKLEEELRFYINYYTINTIIIKNRYSISQIREIFNNLYRARFYTKFNIIIAFNNLRIKLSTKQIIVFNTRYGQFKYFIILFELYNTLSSF